MSNTFLDTSIIENLPNGHDRLIIDKRWNMGKASNGGYLMAHAAKALASHSPHPHPYIVNAFFLDKSTNSETELSTEVLRVGKSISTLSGRVLQANANTQTDNTRSGAKLDSEKIRLTASFTDFSYAKGENFSDQKPPKIARFEECIPVEEVAPTLQIYKQFNIRIDPSCTGWNSGDFLDKAETHAWVEFNEPRTFDVFSLLMIPDVRPPAIFCVFGAHGWVPTLEMTVNIRALPNTSRLQMRTKTRHLSQGTMEEDVELWDAQGNILAISRQIAKLRIKPGQ